MNFRESNIPENQGSQNGPLDFEVISQLGWPEHPLVVSFFVVLEEPLPVPDGVFVDIIRPDLVPGSPWKEGHNFVNLRVHRHQEVMDFGIEKERVALLVASRATGNVSKLERFEHQNWHGPKFQTTILGTVIEAATPLIPTESGDRSESMSEAFDRCLSELRRLMTAYSKISANPRFRPVTRQRCRKYVPCSFQGTNGSWSELRFFTANEGLSAFPIVTEEMDLEVLYDVAILVDRDNYDDPILLATDRARAARRAFDIDGDFPSAIVLAYTACEVLLNSVLLMTSWESGTPRRETRNWFDGQQGFLSRVTRFLPDRLGGNWSSQKPDDPISRLRRLANVRHDVVHYGYSPTEAQVVDGLDVVRVLDDFVRARLAAKRKTYPRTALLVLGKPGMLRHGIPEQWVDDFLATTANKEPTWLAAYRQWLRLPDTLSEQTQS